MAIKRRLKVEGFDISLHTTRGAGDGGDYARRFGNHFDLVIVSGGDGTIRDVVSGMVGMNVPFTVFPSGTENLFAKEMGIHSDLDQLIQTIKWGRTVTMDMGQVNGKVYLLLSGIGFDAEVLMQLNKFRTGNITHLTYFWPIWRTLWEYHFPPMTIEADGEVLAQNVRGLAFVSNISRYAVGLRICQKADFDDGLLDVCFYRCTHRLPLVAHSWRTLRGTHLNHTDVIYRQAKKITITSDIKIPFETDGDPAGYLPAVYSVVPHAIQVRLPAG